MLFCHAALPVAGLSSTEARFTLVYIWYHHKAYNPETSHNLLSASTWLLSCPPDWVSSARATAMCVRKKRSRAMRGHPWSSMLCKRGGLASPDHEREAHHRRDVPLPYGAPYSCNAAWPGHQVRWIPLALLEGYNRLV